MRSAQKEVERAEIVRNMAELESHQQNVYREWEEVNAGLRKELEMAKKREVEAHEREVEAQRREVEAQKREAEAREEAMRNLRGSADIHDEVQQQRQTIDEMNLQLKLLNRSLEIAKKQNDFVMSQQLVASMNRIQGGLERMERRVSSQPSWQSQQEVNIKSPGAISQASSQPLSPEKWDRSADDKGDGLKLHHFESPLHLRTKLKSLFTRGYKQHKEQQQGAKHIQHHHHHHHHEDDDDVESVLSERSEEEDARSTEEEKVRPDGRSEAASLTKRQVWR